MRLPSPLPTALRFVGAASRVAPFGLSIRDDADGCIVSPTSHELDAIAAEIPIAESLARHALVVVLPTSTAGGLRSLFTATKAPTRSARAGALLARGYVELGACVDPHTKLDLVWGRAP